MVKKIIIIFIALSIGQSGNFSLWAKEETALIRKPIVAGQLYPSDKNELNRYIKELLTKTPTKELPGKIVALIVPHAGYIYPKGKFETPLGLVEVDEDLSSRLMKDNPKIKFIPGAHQMEHSLEVQLPFFTGSS